jgi:hypothetical protein
MFVTLTISEIESAGIPALKGDIASYCQLIRFMRLLTDQQMEVILNLLMEKSFDLGMESIPDLGLVDEIN